VGNLGAPAVGGTWADQAQATAQFDDRCGGAIKAQLGENHLALESMNFTVAEWTMINTPISDQVARRNENVVLLDNSEAIVAQAVRLLEQREWAEVAAGLVVLTGRRSSEILGTSDFQSKSQWSVVFSGALKRRGEVQRLSFEIPTLTTAERVIAALAKLRQMCLTEGLSAQQINQKYSQAVATACDRQFSNLVPHRDGRGNLACNQDTCKTVPRNAEILAGITLETFQSAI
jgi:CRISPR/Cas system-associated protein endoribonuclease Cas2